MSAWSDIECELIVADYFNMLRMELAGKSFNKAEHNRNLQALLPNRSKGAIEFKHQNISAALIKLGQPYIRGYLPRFNIQTLLAQKVVNYLQQNQSIEQQFQHFAEASTLWLPAKVDFDKWQVEPPSTRISSVSHIINEPDLIYSGNPIKTNYLEREQRNTRLGELGEELVLEYERWQLRQLGGNRLADQITWVSKDDDRAGYDILSRNPDGSRKFIEVKTTQLGKETPFYFSKGELQFSQRTAHDYHLYRVFNFSADTKIFQKNGSLDLICQSEPVGFRGFF